MSEQMDDVAKALASGVSRRSALRTLLTGVAGLGAVALVTRSARAQDSDVAACIKEFCFGRTGLDRAFCNMQCAMGIKGNNFVVG